tara:strand:+ start:828 stop:1319 length:492 start_codon:yes stop_codon:yes gene_type:complete
MKSITVLLLFTFLATTFAAFSLDGPHGDGRFLAHPASASAKACPEDKFHKLTLVSGEIANYDKANGEFKDPNDYDGSGASACVACAKAALLDDTATGFKIRITTATGDSTDLNRLECCYNGDGDTTDAKVCREQLRAYQEGCLDTGIYAAGTNAEGYGGGSCS